MATYFLKQKDTLYRFSNFFEIENFTGKDRRLYNKSLAKTVRMIFPNGELAGYAGAHLKGWIDLNGEIIPSLIKGNTWKPTKHARRI